MGVRVIVKALKQDAGSLEGHGGKLVAERWGLEYREAHTLSIDPTALEILDREASRRLGVLPLEFGPDGPVFAVAEPSEERFAAVRDLAGDNATFVVVASETLDALLNSKVFSAPNTQRRPTLFRTRTDDDLPSHDTAELDPNDGEATDVEPESPAEEASADHLALVSSESPPSDEAEPAPTTTGEPSSSTSALDSLLTQIRSGAGSLRAQVEHLTESLETTQRELREANEQLAEATRVAEEHDQVVAGLKREVERLAEQLAGSSSLNESMTARLEEVARELMEPASGEAGR
jgi:hypothetical protein